MCGGASGSEQRAGTAIDASTSSSGSRPRATATAAPTMCLRDKGPHGCTRRDIMQAAARCRPNLLPTSWSSRRARVQQSGRTSQSAGTVMGDQALQHDHARADTRLPGGYADPDPQLNGTGKVGPGPHWAPDLVQHEGVAAQQDAEAGRAARDQRPAGGAAQLHRLQVPKVRRLYAVARLRLAVPAAA